MLTKKEIKTIKKFLKRNVVSEAFLRKYLTETYYPHVMRTLFDEELICRESSDEYNLYDEPIPTRNFKIYNRNKCENLVRMYVTDKIRFLIPVSISALALIVSIIALFVSTR